jgi:hypothetical protein
MNLEGLVSLAELAEHAGVDLWNFHTADGRGIRKAIEFLAPFARDPKNWSTKQIEPIQTAKFYSIVRAASKRYKDPEFQKLIVQVSKSKGDESTKLVPR